MSVAYRPIRALASGGMADVFIGMQYSDTGFNRLCAIKRIKGQSDQDAEFISMFRDEAKICQTLQHANVVQVLDFTTMEENCALIMEFIQGVNMSSLLKKFRSQNQFVPLPVTLYVCAEVAKGLQYVHTRKDPMTDRSLNIVHRDISPSNVLISYEGEVKITDFGIAKAQDNSHQTQVGVIKGKYQYMSPEQFQAKKIDYRTDIFALGCILWESVAGRKMFSASSEAHLLQLVMEGPPRAHLNEFNADADDTLNAIVQKAIAIDKDSRYQSAGEFASDMTGYMNSRFKQFSALDMTQFLGQYLGQELANNKHMVKEVLEKFQSAQPMVNPGQPIANFPNSSPSHPQPTSSGTPTGINIAHGSGDGHTVQIQTGMGGRSAPPGGLNITVNLGDESEKDHHPQVSRGIDLELNDEPSLKRSWTASERKKLETEDTKLGWTSTALENTGNHTITEHTYRNHPGELISKLLNVSILLIVLCLLTIPVLQYLVGIDVIGGIQSLAAKIPK